MSAKKKCFPINFVHWIYWDCQILSALTIECHCLHLHSECLHLPDTNS